MSELPIDDQSPPEEKLAVEREGRSSERMSEQRRRRFAKEGQRETTVHRTHFERRRQARGDLGRTNAEGGRRGQRLSDAYRSERGSEREREPEPVSVCAIERRADLPICMTTHPARAHRASRGLVRAPSNELGPLHPPSLAASAESAPPSFVFTFSHDDRPTTLSLALLTRLLPPVVPAAPALPCPPFRKCNRQVICIAVARPSAHGVMGKGRTTSAICQGQLIK